MSGAERIFPDQFTELFPGFDVNRQNIEATSWSVLHVRGKLLDEAFDSRSLTRGFDAWVSEHCTGRYFVSYWLPDLNNDQATLVVCFEDATSAMNVRMRWT
jgi:hypothetical protein